MTATKRQRQLDFLTMQCNLLGTFIDINKSEFDQDILDFTRPHLKVMRDYYIKELEKLNDNNNETAAS